MKKENSLKVKTPLSGSVPDQPIESKSVTMPAEDNKDPAVLDELLLDKILDSEWFQGELKEMASEPYYMLISDHSPVLLFSMSLKAYRTVPCPIAISPVESAGDGKTYCVIGNDMYIVADDLIKNVGWN